MYCKLSDLKLLTAARIAELSVQGAVRRRLQDLGFVPGSEVRALYAGSRGSIRAYAIGGSVIALRRGDAERITVQE